MHCIENVSVLIRQSLISRHELSCWVPLKNSVRSFTKSCVHGASTRHRKVVPGVAEVLGHRLNHGSDTGTVRSTTQSALPARDCGITKDIDDAVAGAYGLTATTPCTVQTTKYCTTLRALPCTTQSLAADPESRLGNAFPRSGLDAESLLELVDTQRLLRLEEFFHGYSPRSRL
jgi:hypothetical protein